MNSADFDTQFDRLTGHFHLPTDGKRETIALDWFQSMEHYSLSDLDRAVTELIRTSQDRFWPALGKVLTLLQARVDKYERSNGKCQTCKGSTLIDSAPFISNGMIYENACVRCPDCGVPQLAYTAPSHRTGLSASECREWSQGRHQKNYMPEGLQAKPRPAGDRGPMAAAMQALRIRLFGRAYDQTGEEVA